MRGTNGPKMAASQPVTGPKSRKRPANSPQLNSCRQVRQSIRELATDYNMGLEKSFIHPSKRTPSPKLSKASKNLVTRSNPDLSTSDTSLQPEAD